MMNLQDAFSVLNISEGYITAADIKLAYRKAAALYHPDHNPAGLEMMKLVNLAYKTLKGFEGEVRNTEAENYGETINNALNAIIGLGIGIEICGVWIWVSGNTKPHKETLKSAGYFWAPKKMQWYFRPSEHKSCNRGEAWSMEKIRKTYGSDPIKSRQQSVLQAN